MGQTPGLKNSLQITPDTKGHNPGLKIPFKSHLTPREIIQYLNIPSNPT
jgi:hypothetical protein